MKIYIVTCSVSYEIETSEKFSELLEFYMSKIRPFYNKNDVENGCFMSESISIEDKDVGFVIAEDYFANILFEFYEKLKKVFEELNIDYKDITKEVVLGNYKNQFFEQIFFSENGDLADLINLKKYLIKFSSKDDILEKIKWNKNSILSDLDKEILNDTAKINFKYETEKYNPFL